MLLSELFAHLKNNYEIMDNLNYTDINLNGIALNKPEKDKLYVFFKDYVYLQTNGQSFKLNTTDLQQVIISISHLFEEEKSSLLELLKLSLKKQGLLPELTAIAQVASCSLLVFNRYGLLVAKAGKAFNNLPTTITSQKLERHYAKRTLIKRELMDSYRKLGALYILPDQPLYISFVNDVCQLLENTVVAQNMVSSANTKLEDELVNLLLNRQVAVINAKCKQAGIRLPNIFTFIFVKPRYIANVAIKKRMQLEFNQLFGFSISSIYQGILISMVKMPVKNYYSKELRDGMRALAKQYQLQLVVANPTTNLLALREVYRAGKLVYDHLDKKPDIVFCYQRALSLLAQDKLEQNLLPEFISPIISFLEDYDHQHNSSLLLTLTTYLNHECNIAQTAATLFMHRNTVSNHLHRIRKLCAFNFNDFNQLYWLKQSFLLQAAMLNK